MLNSLSPKARRNIQRIIPFAVIWVVTGWVFLLVEAAATRNVNPDPSTAITLNLQVILFASLAVAVVGLVIGALEMIFLENLFRDKSFLQKILYKLGLYTLLLLLIITLTYPIAGSLESGLSPFDAQVWQKFGRFLVSITFLSTLLQMAFSLLLCLLYAGISENLGHAVLTNFFTGKYHTPKEEKRIFMFLDMKSSTTVAEQLGHIRYFELLSEYYADLSDAIIRHEGEVYQYVGDEVVISWKYEAGLKANNCVRCFFAMKEDLEKRSACYRETYGLAPTFKAGLHLGEVTTGEIGALKKEIIFSGDVLNATARIQGLCNTYSVDLLLSGELVEALAVEDEFALNELGTTELKGRKEPMELFSLQERSGVKN